MSVARRNLPSLRFAHQGVLALGIRLIAAALALALQISWARALGQAGYGEYAYAFAWLQLLLIFAHGGFTTASLRYVAEYLACAKSALLQGFLTRSSQVVLGSSLMLALIMSVSAVVLNQFHPTHSLQNFLIASCTLPVLAQFALNNAIVRGLGQVIPTMLIELAQPLLLLAGLLTITHGFHHRFSSSGALLLTLAGAAAVLSISRLLRRHCERRLDCDTQHPQQSYLTREWVVTASQMMIASCLIYLQGRTGVIVSGLLLDAGQAGAYAAMERLADAALLGLVSVNMLVAPSYAALYAQQRKRALQHQARLAAWASTAFMLATVIPLAVFCKPILRLFGDEFAAGYPVLLILLSGVVVNAACGSVGLLLSMTGHQGDSVRVAFCCLCLNVLLSLIVVPRWGILGTAFANAFTMATWNLTMLFIVRWRLGIWACVGSSKEFCEPTIDTEEQVGVRIAA